MRIIRLSYIGNDMDLVVSPRCNEINTIKIRESLMNGVVATSTISEDGNFYFRFEKVSMTIILSFDCYIGEKLIYTTSFMPNYSVGSMIMDISPKKMIIGADVSVKYLCMYVNAVLQIAGTTKPIVEKGVIKTIFEPNESYDLGFNDGFILGQML